MKKSKEEAVRWLRQAEHNLMVAESNFKAGFYSDACFMCEQAAQMALKTYLIFTTGRPIAWERSIQTLARRCRQYDEEFEEAIEYGKILDRYYIPTRYPDALSPPAVPYETYIEKDASEAISFSRKIMRIAERKIKHKLTNDRNAKTILKKGKSTCES